MGMLPELEDQYPECSDLTIMNAYYSYPQYGDNGKICDDYMFLVYKDNNTGKKGYKIIPKPDYTFYRIKDGVDVPRYNQLFISRDKVDPVTVPYHKLEENIAELVGKADLYKQNLRNRDRLANRAFHTEPEIFFSDVSIEDHYRFKFAQTYSNSINKIYKGFFDIEVDSKWAKGDFVEMGECEINCVSFYDDKTDTVYVYILRNSDNPLIKTFEDEIKSGTFGWQQMHDFIVEAVGGQKKAKKYGLLNTQFNINFYDYEIELIKDLFRNMHRCSPDFIMGWNSSAFDLSYIIQRVINLGYDPTEILCDQSWPVKMVKNYVDARNINEFAERGDYTFISGCPVFIDQMIQYASRRKAKFGSFASFKLDDIGELEAGVKKLDYHHITNNITELPWLDFKTFVLYNIMDVIVQKCIEVQANDLEYIFAKCVLNNTSYKKGHRQTVYLINRMASEWYKMGYVIGNNCNKDNPKGAKFLGALVGNPDNTNDYSKMKIDGRSILVCENLNDYDFKSLYPSIMGEFNIAPNTQIGKIIIPEKVYDGENAYHIDEEKYSRGGEFIENLVTDNMIEYCHRWFHLGNLEEVLEDIDEYYRKFSFGAYSNIATVFSPIIPTVSKSHKVIYQTNSRVSKALKFVDNRPEQYTYYNLIQEAKNI